MIKYLAVFERVVVVVLTVMMALVLLLATVELGYIIIRDMATPPLILLDVKQILDIFGLFLLVLIGIELLETMRIYIVESVIRVQVVFLVALIAIARKVIILDIKVVPSLTLVGIAAIIVTLSAGFYIIKKAQLIPRVKKTPEEGV